MDVVAQYYLEFRIRQAIYMHRAAFFSLLGKTSHALAILLDKDYLGLYFFSFHLGKLEHPARLLPFLFIFGNGQYTCASINYLSSICGGNVVLYFFRHI